MSTINTVIFDLGGVYFTDGATKFINFLTGRYPISQKLADEVVNGDLGSRYRIGTITAKEFWREALKKWNISEDEQVLADEWQSGYVPIEGTVDIVKRLGAAQYELLFLSDNVAERVDYLKSRYSFQKNFKDGVFSHMVGERKPHPKMYEALLAKTSSAAEQCLFIDDKEENLPPASAFGMKTLHYLSPEQLEIDLKSMGVAI